MFDLSVSKTKPVCEQQVTKRTKPIHLCFNPVQPLLLIGDDHGNVMSFKLSPNLRKVGGELDRDDQVGRLVEVLRIEIIEVF